MNYMEKKNREHIIDVGKKILRAGEEFKDALPEEVKKDLKELDMVITYLQCGLHVPDELEKALLRLIRTAEDKGNSVEVFKTYDAETRESVLFILEGISSDDTFPEQLRTPVNNLIKSVEAWDSGALTLSGMELQVFAQITMAVQKYNESQE